MKIFYSLIATSLLMSLVGCSLDTTVIKEEIKEDTKEYLIDVNESFIDCRDGSDYRLIEPINNRMGEIVDSLIYEVKSNAITSSSRKRQAAVKHKLMTQDTVFKVTMGLISTRITADIYGRDGHRTMFYGVNYRPETGRFLSRGDIFDISKVANINAAIAAHVGGVKCEVAPTFEIASAISVSKSGAIFSYDSGVLGGECGAVVIEVPLKELKDYLKL